MGVVIHILDRRMAWLDVAGTVQEIGTLRQLGKVTELDGPRAAELGCARLIPSPLAVLVAQAVDLSLAPGLSVAAHPVIGWDEERGSVTDLGWDYLPVLGHAVRDMERDVFVLHELHDGTLRRINPERANKLGLLADGVLVRHGQPAISACLKVKPFIADFAEADCILADGRRERLLVRIAGNNLPDPAWLVGRRPMDVENYLSDRAAAGTPG